MKIRIELDEYVEDVEVIIRAKQMTDDVLHIQQILSQKRYTQLIFYKENREYFLKLDDILFFETDGAKIFAHSRSDAYEVRLKLYELEECLPRYFCRVAKSTIVNIKNIYSIERSFSGTSTASFYETYKQIHISRHYYQLLKEKLRETR